MGIRDVASAWRDIKQSTKETAENTKQISTNLRAASTVPAPEILGPNGSPARNQYNPNAIVQNLGPGYVANTHGYNYVRPTPNSSGGTGHGGIQNLGNAGVITTNSPGGNGPGIQKPPGTPGAYGYTGALLPNTSYGSGDNPGYSSIPPPPNNGGGGGGNGNDIGYKVAKAIISVGTRQIELLERIDRKLTLDNGTDFRRKF